MIIAGDGSWADIELSFLDLPLIDTADDWGPHWHGVATVQLRSVRGLQISNLRAIRTYDSRWICALFVDNPGGGAALYGWLAPLAPQQLRPGRIVLSSGGKIAWKDAVATLVVHAGEPASPRGGGPAPG